MTYDIGWAALNLEMPERVPRTEYSAEFYWDLVKEVTGLNVTPEDEMPAKINGMREFMIAWDYDIFWSTAIDGNVFGEHRTRMGHASYAAGGVDFDDNVGSPFEDPDDVYSFDPFEAYGEVNHQEAVAMFEKDYKFKCELSPNAVNMTGVYVTCVSGLIDIFGWDLLLESIGEDADEMGKVVARYGKWIKQYFDALADSNVPVAGVHDDMVWTSGPFTRPEWYRKYVFPVFKELLDPLRQANKKIVYACDGDFTEFIPDCVDCGVNAFVIEPNTDLKFFAEHYKNTHCFIGNVDTRILLGKGKAEIRAEVERCFKTAKDCPGWVLAVGNHIPPNTPIENALYYNEVYNELAKR